MFIFALVSKCLLVPATVINCTNLLRPGTGVMSERGRGKAQRRLMLLEKATPRYVHFTLIIVTLDDRHP
jgi:hypothetical protein